MLEVVCANQLYISWKFWVGGNLNIINQWGEPQKEEGNQIFKVQWGGGGEQKGGITIFDLNFLNLVVGTLEETMTV